MSILLPWCPAWLRPTAMGLLLGTCASPATLQIIPVDAELNRALLTGTGLDTRLFSVSQPVQYYEVNNLNTRSPRAGQAALDSFIRQRYTRTEVARLQQLAVLFYYPTRFVDYRTEAYEAARDSDAGFLTEHHDALAAQLRLARIAGPGQRWRRQWVVYHEQAVALATTDTVSIDQLLPR